jgi:hypothetical protein
MAYHNNITFLTQRAIAEYLRKFGLSFYAVDEDTGDNNVYESLLKVKAVVPNVLVKCPSAQCKVSTDGTWLARCRVELRENADDTEAEDHFEHAGELFSAFATATLDDDVNAAVGSETYEYSAQQIVRLEQGWSVDGRLWVSYLELAIDCCGSRLG